MLNVPIKSNLEHFGPITDATSDEMRRHLNTIEAEQLERLEKKGE